jgi:L-fuconolactonase
VIIDTHTHVWWRGDGHLVRIRDRVQALDRDFHLEILAPALADAGVGQVVLVSAAQTFDDTRRLLAVAAAHPGLVGGVVGYLDPLDEDFRDKLAIASSNPRLLGLRLPLVVMDDPRWIRLPAVATALDALAARQLVAQVLAAPAHLSDVAAVLAEHSGLRAVIDHAGNPGPVLAADQNWQTGIKLLGSRTKVACKIGDFTTPGAPAADATRSDAILSHVSACFGHDRLVIGSNWPVSTLAQSYGATLSGLFASAERIGLDPDRLKDDALRTTLRLYRLNDPSPKLSA